MRNPNSRTLVILASANSADECVKAVKNQTFDEDNSLGIDKGGATIDYEYSDETCSSLHRYFLETTDKPEEGRSATPTTPPAERPNDLLHWIGLTPAANEIADRVAVFLHAETQNVDHTTVQMTDVLTGFLGPVLEFIDMPWEKPTPLSVLEGVIRIVISDVPNWRFPDDDNNKSK